MLIDGDELRVYDVKARMTATRTDVRKELTPLERVHVGLAYIGFARFFLRSYRKYHTERDLERAENYCLYVRDILERIENDVKALTE